MTTVRLTRDQVATGAIDAMVARDAPDLPIFTDAERRASLLETLAAKPQGDVWLFGYGSLIWNPMIRFAESRVARITGWHRAFCLATPAGRGTVDNPGLVLGLDQGGHCDGVAFRIADEMVEPELAMLWKREMLAAAYVPRWLDLLDRSGHRFASGIAFTIDPNCGRYDGGLPRDQIVRRLATASGALGSSAEYLFNTCKSLRAHGIQDDEIERLQNEVASVQLAAQR